MSEFQELMRHPAIGQYLQSYMSLIPYPYMTGDAVDLQAVLLMQGMQP